MKQNLANLFIIGIIAQFMFSCGAQKLGSESSFDAGILANEYAADIKAADKKYKGRYLTITGIICQSYKNKYQENIILLMDKNQKNGVKCILNNAIKQLKKPPKQGESITINGKCSGYSEYVILTNCVIFKN